MARLNDEIGQLAAEGVAATGQGSKYKEEAAALLQVNCLSASSLPRSSSPIRILTPL